MAGAAGGGGVAMRGTGGEPARPGGGEPTRPGGGEPAQPGGGEPARPRVWRIVGVAVVALVALNLLGSAIDAATGGVPGGPRSSSYATGHDGLAAYYDLVRDFGHAVARRRDDGPLDPSTTAVVLDPREVSSSETRALRTFVLSGGRLVAGGRNARDLLSAIAPGARGGAGRARELRAGRGRIVALAGTTRLQNGMLAENGNAAFGLGLVGSPGRRVVFDETVHGYGPASGLAALPEGWKWALGGLLLAGAVWIASRVRRLGPAEEESRPLPPPRRAYVDAVGAALARWAAPAASAERRRRAARERLERRAALGLGGHDPDLPSSHSHDDEEDLLIAGRALARTYGGTP